MLLIRAPKVAGFHVVVYLIDDEHISISSTGLQWVIWMPHIRVNHGFFTTLAKRWYNEHNTFHLPIGEASITLEDVFCID